MDATHMDGATSSAAELGPRRSVRHWAVRSWPPRAVMPQAKARPTALVQSPAAAHQGAEANQSDLDKTLATLAAALAADLTARRQGGSDQLNDQSQTVVNRREAQ